MIRPSEIQTLRQSPEIQTLRQSSEIQAFQKKIFSFYDAHGRSMPWRTDTSPYSVFVSEMMLQQTQVSRVQKFFQPFCMRFPNFQALAESSLAELLLVWKGLGYNRRAKFMRQSAQIIQSEYAAILPADPLTLIKLPGIGANTAGSIATFAYNRDSSFIETNIRRVFIHEFFPPSQQVQDREIMPLIAATLPAGMARIWYWALMDYGASLKKVGREAARRSYHHSKQATFSGSVRQLRGEILHCLSALSQKNSGKGGIHLHQLSLQLKEILPDHPFNSDVLGKTLGQLQQEGFVVAEDDWHYRLEK